MPLPGASPVSACKVGRPIGNSEQLGQIGLAFESGQKVFESGKLHIVEIGNLRRDFVLLRDDAVDQLVEPLFGPRKSFDRLFLM